LPASIQPGFTETGVANTLPAPAVDQVDVAVAAEQQSRSGEFGAAVDGRFDSAAGFPVLTVVGG
jgi:hypothetical protein